MIQASEPSISLFLKASETGIRTKEISKPVCYVFTCYVFTCLRVMCLRVMCYMLRVTCYVLHVMCYVYWHQEQGVGTKASEPSIYSHSF